MELYKKYRPQTFDDVIGSEGTVEALRGMLQRNALPHTLLFHGPSGCGKTTLARILRAELKCNDFDFAEVNTSSFRGIDTVREIQRVASLAPVGGSCRVWLMDECHRWTADSMNAMLKLLEDTPKHVYFFLCTTEPDKLLRAVRTRCCEMPVRLLTYDELEKLCKRVEKREEIKLSDDVRDAVVAAAQGSARALLVLLDKVLNVAHLDDEGQKRAVEEGAAEQNAALDLCRALLQKASWKKVAGILKNLKADPENVRWAVLGYARSVLLGEANHQAYLLIECFKKPFYDSKEAGLVGACFEAIHAE